MPMFNASDWLDECLQAILEQDFPDRMELSVYDDGSTDNSRELLERWRQRFEDRGLPILISGHSSPSPRGACLCNIWVGFAKNQAVRQSSGRFLCFQDADDIMRPQRVRLQYEAAAANPTAICKVAKTKFSASLMNKALISVLNQVYTSHGPTVIMPTWFCSRDWFEKVGPFNEGGKVSSMFPPEALLLPSLSLQCVSDVRDFINPILSSALRETIWSLRVHFLQERVLSQWESFTVWNAGKQGRRLYRSLSPTNQKKVKAFCDVDENKIQKGFYTYEDSKERPKPRIPVLHFTNASPPMLYICVRMYLFMMGNLHSLQLKEGVHYYHFS
uniref:UDP-GlcNAc:betaGal beta-1,3-N-acetylglucosaminyltransferase-like 1 n=1 Tax=Sinocyclocheilus anshuiensis TaxID=1608454 RepID=A0A671MHJ2_9TELE